MPIVIMIFDDFARDIPQANFLICSELGERHIAGEVCVPLPKK